jgi:hypothetical protein
MMLGLVRLEIEVQHDERPVAMGAGCERALDERPDALEEVLAQRRFLACIRLLVGNDRAAGLRRRARPREILFDGHGHAGGEGTVDPIAPLPVIGVRVVGVQKNAAARLEPGAPAPEERAHDRQRRKRSPDSRSHEMATDGLNSQSQTCRGLLQSASPAVPHGA